MATTLTGSRRTLAKVGVITGLVVGALFAGLPVVWMLSTSFKNNGEVFQNPPNLITESFSLDAYWEILGNGAQLRFFLNSYIVAFAVTILTLLVVPALYALWFRKRLDERGVGEPTAEDEDAVPLDPRPALPMAAE